MYQKRLQSFRDLPVQYEERRKTDICCCIIGFIFGLALFIIACIVFNQSNVMRANFPADKTGAICVLDEGSDQELYPALYFNDYNDPLANRYCLKNCPVSRYTIQCRDGPCLLDYYPTYLQKTRLGYFCMPTDQKLKEKLLQNTDLQDKYDALKAIDNLLIAFGISMGLGLLWMILVQCFPRAMVWVAIILAIILLLILAIVFFANAGGKLSKATGWAIIIAIIALVFCVFLIIYLCSHTKQVKLCGIFLQNATIMLSQNCCVFFYIPVFIILTILFCILIVFQFVAFVSISTPQFHLSSLFYTTQKPFFWTVLLIIQLFWGLSFLRDAFDYCVSGCAIQWYYRRQVNCCGPVKSLICKHFGSVVGGSFLSAFFYIPDMIVNLCCSDVDCCLCNCFDILRGDSYPYIYLTGSSYCNAARQCQYLCQRSQICRGNESTNSVYSLAARLVLALSTVLITYWISETLSYQNPYTLLGAFLIALFITSYFVDIHIDVSEALLITFLCEYDIENEDYTEMECRETIKNKLQALEQIEKRTAW